MSKFSNNSTQAFIQDSRSYKCKMRISKNTAYNPPSIITNQKKNHSYHIHNIKL